MYKLYYYPGNASLAPHLVLEDLGESYELVLVDRNSNQQKSAEYLALNPFGRIPTLVHNDLVMFESSAICLYLCEMHAESTLIPNTEDSNRPLFYQWLMYLNNTVQTETLIYVYPEKHTTNKNHAPSIRQAQENRLMAMYDLLNTHLEGRSYLVGDSVTVCDYFLLMTSIWGRGLPKPPLSFSNLGPYLTRLSKSEAVKRVFEKEGISLNG